MYNSTIHLTLDLGRNQHLWNNTLAAFDELLTKEPAARHAAILMLVQRAQELEPKPATLEQFKPQESVALGTEIPIECGAVLHDDRWFCDRCAIQWTNGDSKPQCKPDPDE